MYHKIVAIATVLFSFHLLVGLCRGLLQFQEGVGQQIPQGLVGRVVETSAGSAVVRTVLDPQSRVGITGRGRGGQGIAMGLPDGNIRVADFIEVDEVRVGDLVETNSIGGLYPRGVLVGTVVEVPLRDPNGLRRTFTVEPAVELSTLLEVALISPQ